MTEYTPFRRAYHHTAWARKEDMHSCLYTLPTFPLGPCPPASPVSRSVFISFPLIANKVNEKE